MVATPAGTEDADRIGVVRSVKIRRGNLMSGGKKECQISIQVTLVLPQKELRSSANEVVVFKLKDMKLCHSLLQT